MDKLGQELIEVVNEISNNKTSIISLNTHFTNIGEWDSLCAVTLISYYQKKYNVFVSLSKMNRINTLGDFLNEIKAIYNK